MSKYLLSWDIYGLEALIPLDPLLAKVQERDKELLFQRITDPDGNHHNEAIAEINRHVNYLMMRARYNSQRHYEIYCVDTTDEITEAWLRQMFQDSPQSTVDLIRERGEKIYSDRVTAEPVIR